MERNERRKVLFFLNIIAPYNISLFNKLNSLLNKNILFFFDQPTEANRSWKIAEDNIAFSYTIENSPNIQQLTKAVNNTSLSRTIYFPFFVFKRIWLHKPAVVISIEFGLRTIFSLMMCKLTGAKLVVVSDVTPTTEATTGLLKRVVRKAIAKNINAAVARSYTAKRYLESLGMRGQAIVVAPYAIEAHVIKKQGDVNTLANLVAQKSQKKFCFFYSGHFIHLKGIDLLVRAVASLPLEVRDKILIVLAGGSENELRELVGPYDTDKFLTLGFVPNDQILSVYPLADCFILPTRSDTWGLVVNEAVVAGCPVMVSKYAGSAGELIEDAISGIVFDPLDQKQFVDKLAFCIQNKALLVSYAAKAKEKLQEYNNDVSAKRIANLIEEINGK